MPLVQWPRIDACLRRGPSGGADMRRWVTLVIGAIVGLVGLVWIGQGIGAIGGSGMTGMPVFAVLGAVLVIAAGVILARARGAAGSS